MASSSPPTIAVGKTFAFVPPLPLLSRPLFASPRRSSIRFTAAAAAAVSNGAAAQKWDPAKVVPQADRVLIRLEELPEKTSGGVLLPKSSVTFERYLMGEILSMGTDAGGFEAGKKVLFSDINAHEVDLGTDAKHCFCKAGDLLAIVE